eukprot:s1796_g17.t1
MRVDLVEAMLGELELHSAPDGPLEVQLVVPGEAPRQAARCCREALLRDILLVGLSALTAAEIGSAQDPKEGISWLTKSTESAWGHGRLRGAVTWPRANPRRGRVLECKHAPAGFVASAFSCCGSLPCAGAPERQLTAGPMCWFLISFAAAERSMCLALTVGQAIGVLETGPGGERCVHSHVEMTALPDDMVASDLTSAIVLAGVRHKELLFETIAAFDDGPKRRSRWSECKVAKKGKRWGLPDDKPYKPLSYVDLPMGLSEKEIDQFLREQRLEDLHRKIQAHELEDVDPDIRPPSPPPVYDKGGNRLNTRDVRIRKGMTAEYNRLIRYMIKHVDGYLPPVDWKPAKLMKKIIIPIEPQKDLFQAWALIPDTTGCKIFIRGRDIGDKWQTDEEAAMPQHVHIEGETEEQQRARNL